MKSHLSVGKDYAKEIDIIILKLPRHTANKLQLLGRNVLGHLNVFNKVADKWMTCHPGNTLTIYDLPAIYVDAWDKGTNPINVKSGLRCTGILLMRLMTSERWN